MMAETFLLCWLIISIYLPFLYYVTRYPSQEEISLVRVTRRQ